VESRRGYTGVQKEGWGVFVVFVGGGHRASTGEQKGEKVLQSSGENKKKSFWKTVAKRALGGTQKNEKQKGEKVLQNYIGVGGRV
jgi:hypothetical protein